MTTATTQRVPAPLVMSLGDGDRGMVDLLGGKGANLAEMTRLGLPVPHGFVITTEACRAYLAHGQEPAELEPLVADRLRELEAAAGRRFGHPDDPLLVSVRSGARFSMPGMMETILNVGLTDDTLPGLAARGGDRFAWDCYRRLVQMYGRTVLGIDAGLFEQALARARHEHDVARPGQRLLEEAGVDAEHRAPVHLHQPPVTVPREAVATAGGQTGRVSSVSPTLRIVSIMPGIENLAPDRTETSSGSSGWPNLRPAAASSSRSRSATSGSSSAGS